MRIGKVTYRNKNDFHFIAECNCGRSTHVTDGYADAFYQLCVFPDRKCPHCGMNEHGETVNDYNRVDRQTSKLSSPYEGLPPG